ncbi:MAG: hypothetical protein GXP06_01760 [Alphaproteobacteria bacterium]|nr:hypothetical protein [Alphaproteobacteria bacterium]
MSRFKLPDGVPLDNAGKARFGARGEGLPPILAGASADFKAPDMATPQLGQPARGASRQSDTRHMAHTDIKEALADDEDIKLIPAPARMLVMFTAIAALLAAVGGFVIMNRGDAAPLCSSQPAWNQYNCTPG